MFKRRIGLNATKSIGRMATTTVVLEPQDQKQRRYDAWAEKILDVGAYVRVQC